MVSLSSSSSYSSPRSSSSSKSGIRQSLPFFSYSALFGFIMLFVLPITISSSTELAFLNPNDRLAQQHFSTPELTADYDVKEQEREAAAAMMGDSNTAIGAPKRTVYLRQPQFKRLRPCFYSPIQCLMKKKRSDETIHLGDIVFK
ncbi:unnamed protein product [Anisakis simplex]|uniref:Uncharacterized protein n=1 Tax=Anisakis simplex TaxID=6269 RepID=A0A0M3JVD1_ANISI|nr:unnamed protein product [Anisakis simplex]